MLHRHQRRPDKKFDAGLRLTAGDHAQDDASFGYALSIGDGFIMVGAPFESADAGTIESGAAYIYVEIGDNDWSLEKRLTAEIVTAKANLGYTVAVDKDHAVVGVPSAKQGVHEAGNVGLVYVY